MPCLLDIELSCAVNLDQLRHRVLILNRAQQHLVETGTNSNGVLRMDTRSRKRQASDTTLGQSGKLSCMLSEWGLVIVILVAQAS